jgi:phosphatidate cytidylyltransferase
VTIAPDRQLLWAFGGVLAVLALSTAIGFVLQRTVKSPTGQSTVSNLNARIRAWWAMSAIFALTLLVGRFGSLALFGLMSFLAFREYVALLPARLADHRTLFWAFFIFTPLQYALIGINDYGLFAILIPVYAFLFVASRLALAGDTDSFLERVAKMQWGLMVCVYCLSYAPALLMLNIRGYAPDAKLLLYLVLVDQLGDVLQYVWGKLAGRRAIAPSVSPNKTWEGFAGGVLSATAIGAALWWMTPFSPPAAAALSLVKTLMGFAGGLTMSAIKRDRGVKDYGAMIEGHGGILDRLDSLCFAAPIFFHIVRYFYAR